MDVGIRQQEVRGALTEPQATNPSWKETYGRPGVAMPMGLAALVENVEGVVGTKLPPVLILYPATLLADEFATKTNSPVGLMEIPIGVVAAPVENVAGVVGVNIPPAPIVKPATSFMPLFVTYRKDPFGEIAIR